MNQQGELTEPVVLDGDRQQGSAANQGPDVWDYEDVERRMKQSDQFIDNDELDMDDNLSPCQATDSNHDDSQCIVCGEAHGRISRG